MSSPGPGTLYFHSPCFDGIASAVLASELLERYRGWVGVDLKAVNYAARETWLSTALRQPAAVVDFLYHPAAAFWADHHQTAFLDNAGRLDFERRGRTDLIYDDRAPSCAALLWERLGQLTHSGDPRYHELVEWANRIDSAAYDSIEDIFTPGTPALRLNTSLISASATYCEFLVLELRKRTLSDVVSLPVVRERSESAVQLLRRGLDRFARNVRLEDDGIVVFDVDTAGTSVSRYAPYFIFPNARYSIGIIRGDDWAKVTAMRNPWRDFPSVPLGRIAARFGGGGHRRVASVFLPQERAGLASSILDTWLAEIRRYERTEEARA